MTEQTYEISDIDGKNKRRVTLAQYRAELDARKAAATLVMAAFRSNDIDACAKAQTTMRKRFA